MSLSALPRFPRLAEFPTPGGPVRLQPEWWVHAQQQVHAHSETATEIARALWEAPRPCAQALTVNGVECFTHTVMAWAPQAEAVLCHITGLTNAHREDFRPSLLEHLPDTPLFAATFAFPADSIVSYRITDVTGLPHDSGLVRAQWRAVHERGRPDPDVPYTMATPFGGQASVIYGPSAPCAPWATATPAQEPAKNYTTTRGETTGATLHIQQGDERVVVCFDGQFLLPHDLPDAARAHELGHTFVLIDCGAGPTRADHLTRAENAAALVRDALAAASTLLGKEITRAHLVAGQSFGGLAAAMLAATHPELSACFLAQSGSFWQAHPLTGTFPSTDHTPHEQQHLQTHQAQPQQQAQQQPHSLAPGQDNTTPAQRATKRGALIEAVATGDATINAPLLLQVGCEETGIYQLTQALIDAADEAYRHTHPGSPRHPLVGYREYRGGHDYAWWRHGILDALLHHPDEPTTP